MACPVCFGGGDPVVRDGIVAGMSVLLGVTLVVLGALARFFVRLLRNDAAGDAVAGVAGRIGLHVVGNGVDDQGRPAIGVERI